MTEPLRQKGRGFRPSPLHLVARVPTWRAAGNPVIPEGQWVEFNDWPAEIVRKDQTHYSACCGHASATSLEAERYVAGMPYVPLSAWFPYSILAQGVDEGASIMEALGVLHSDGCAPESDVRYGTIDPSQLTTLARADAKRFRLEIGAAITSWAEFMSAVQLRRTLNFSVCADQWGEQGVDGEGVAPAAGGPADHAVTAGLGAKRLRSGEWVVLGTNSWGTGWGDDGHFWAGQGHIQVQNFEAYTVIAVVDDPNDPSRPPGF